MSDHDFHATPANASANEAERLIEQRIGELRAIALESGDAGAAAGQATYDLAARARMQVAAIASGEEAPRLRVAGDDEVAELRPSPARVDASTPTRDDDAAPAAHVSRRARTPEGTQSSPAMQGAVAATLARIERSVSDDVSRIEHLLRSWGSPSAASSQLGDQLVSALQRVEHSLRKDLGRVIEAVHTASIGGGGDEVGEWGLRIEDTIGSHVAELRRGLLEVEQRVRDAHDEIGRATSGMAAITGSTIGDKVAGALDALREPLLTSIDGVEQAAEGLRGEISTELAELRTALPEELGDVIAEFVEDMHTHVRSTGETTLDAVRESTTHVTRAIDRSEHLVQSAIERLSLAVIETGEQLPIELARQVEETLAQLQTRIEKQTTRQSVVARQVGEDLTAHVSASTDSLRLSVEEAAVSITDQVAEHAATTESHIDQLAVESTRLRERVIELEETLLAVQDDVPEELVEQFTGSLSELRTQLSQDADVAREALLEGVDQLKLEVFGELDTNRLQHVRDTEMVIDAMTAGWTAVINRLQSTDTRLTSLEQRIEQWFSAVDELGADVAD